MTCLMLYIHTFFKVLLVFDTLLSPPSEVKYIWCRRLRLGSILYILTRYSTHAATLIIINLSFSVILPQVCENKALICDICAHFRMYLVRLI